MYPYAYRLIWLIKNDPVYLFSQLSCHFIKIHIYSQMSPDICTLSSLIIHWHAGSQTKRNITATVTGSHRWCANAYHYKLSKLRMCEFKKSSKLRQIMCATLNKKERLTYQGTLSFKNIYGRIWLDNKINNVCTMFSQKSYFNEKCLVYHRHYRY